MPTLSLQGVFTAIATPFTEKGQICKNSLDRLIDHQLAGGVQGLVVTGTTGESPTLTEAETRQITLWVLERVNGQIPVISGLGSNNTEKTLQAAREALALGVNGLSIIAPYYNKPTQEGLFQHFAYIAEKVDAPIMLYANPGRCAIDIGVETVVRLREAFPHIMGIKDCGGSVERLSQLIRFNDPAFSVLTGDDSWVLVACALGGKGIVSMASNVIPRAWVALVKYMDTNDLPEARAVYNQYAPLICKLFAETSPIPVKYVLKQMGIFEHDTLRLPLTALSTAQRPAIDAVLNTVGLITTITA